DRSELLCQYVSWQLIYIIFYRSSRVNRNRRGLGMYNQVMAIQPRTRKPSGPDKRRARWRVPISAIQKLVREIADKFQPDKIILFGSYAYGKPHRDSDVDLLVVMPAWNETSKACQIRLAVHHPFPLDLIVRTPENLRWRLAEEDWFLR